MDQDPIGLLGRALAAIGALVWIGSLYLDLFSEIGSRWDLYRRIDVISLVLAAGAVLLLIVSLFVAKELMLFLVGVIGGYLVGLGTFELLEAQGVDIAAGGYLGALGGGLVVAGAVVALAPTLIARAGEAADLAFVPPEPADSPAVPEAGWYPDPSGQARLRYWDGRGWSTQTQQ